MKKNIYLLFLIFFLLIFTPSYSSILDVLKSKRDKAVNEMLHEREQRQIKRLAKKQKPKKDHLSSHCYRKRRLIFTSSLAFLWVFVCGFAIFVNSTR